MERKRKVEWKEVEVEGTKRKVTEKGKIERKEKKLRTRCELRDNNLIRGKDIWVKKKGKEIWKGVEVEGTKRQGTEQEKKIWIERKEKKKKEITEKWGRRKRGMRRRRGGSRKKESESPWVEGK